MAANGGYLDKSQILKAEDIKYVDLEVEPWGGKVRIRELNATERNGVSSELSRGTVQRDGSIDPNRVSLPPDFYPKIAALCIVDSQGKQLFSEREISKLGEKSWSSIELVANECMRLSGMTQEAVDAEGKDSEETMSDSLPAS